MSAQNGVPVDSAALVVQFGGDPLDAPFWDGCREGRFLLHRCEICQRHYWPASRCVTHGATDMRWVEASGRGEVYTYTVLHHAYTSAMKAKVPYAVVVVKLDEGPFFHAGLADCPLDRLTVGLRVEAAMTLHDSGLTVPMFRPLQRRGRGSPLQVEKRI